MPNCYLCKRNKQEQKAALVLSDPPVCENCLVCPNCGQLLPVFNYCNLCCTEFASGEIESFYRDHYESELPILIFVGTNARVNVRVFGWMVADTLEEIKGCLWLGEMIKQADQPCVNQLDHEFLAHIGCGVNMGELLNDRQEKRLHRIKESLSTLWPLWQASAERRELLSKFEIASEHYKPVKLA